MKSGCIASGRNGAKELIVMSEYKGIAEVVFMDGKTAKMNVFDINDLSYNSTQYNMRSEDFMSLSDEDQLSFVQRHRSERALMRAESATARAIKKGKKPAVSKGRKAKPKLDPERQKILDSLMEGGFSL